MPQFLKSHIVLNERTESLPYTSNSLGRTKVIPRTGLNREAHGSSIRTQFNAAIFNFRQGEIDSDFVYLVFKSPLDFFLDIDKFDKGNCRLSSYKAIETTDADGFNHVYYEATVYLNKSAISEFLKKLEKYINEDTKKGNPKHQSLIANIEEVRAATLQSFWQEPELPFPNTHDVVWWEIWLNRSENDNVVNPIEPHLGILRDAGVQIGNRHLKFPEHWVYLMRASVNQLATSLLYTDTLAEIRKPKDTADFFTYLDRQEQGEWIADIRGRIDHHTEASIISVCLLDTGINRANPLLADLIPEGNLDSVEPAWTKADTHIQGHGTPMAGLALFGDLTEVLASNDRIQIYHHLESVKLIERNQAHNPELYGAVTQEAIARGIIINPMHKRIFCMAVTSEEINHNGRPSSWSSAIDQSVFGSIELPNDTTIFFVSSGNLSLEERVNYPFANQEISIQDPAQAFNAITVGAYTLKDQINLQQFAGAELLASRGNMSPCNTTSMAWESGWCRKPDIVMEGGNQALLNGGTIDPDSLQLLSAAKGGIGRPWLTTFADTSAATALASRFAAELYFHYPLLWPETIRALIVHSADWTPAMLRNRPISWLSTEEQQHLISKVGYGVPNMERAKQSANNSLSLIAERIIKPFKIDGSTIKTDQFHLFNLPWPVEVLQELFNTKIKLKITLSYFIEPNPGNKRYELSASYSSHGLRFKMIDSNESIDAFKARVSKTMREEDYESEGRERWFLGSKVRDKGSIHKDFWECSAADLASRNRIAVYPVGGWWKNRKNLNRFNSTVRYSLIVTIDAPESDIDIYTPVFNQIAVEIPAM